MKKRIFACLLVLLIVSTLPVSASLIGDDIGYQPYVYNYKGDPVPTPETFRGICTLSGKELGVGNFEDISDLVYDGEEHIYISDSGNDRIVVLNRQFDVVTVLENFQNNGTMDGFNNPMGICLQNEKLYVADSGNGRILSFSLIDFSLVREFPKPNIELLADDYHFEPTKLVVDRAERIYIIAKDINQGLIQLDENGEFTTFKGAPKSQVDFLDRLWKKLYTKAQKDRMEQTVPTEYSSMFLDKSGFIYVTSHSSNVPPISRLNSQGVDVLKTGNSVAGVKGDINYVDESGNQLASYFVDITVRDSGDYFALDARNGRVFVYSRDGDMLYQFGAVGTLQGLLQSPSAIELVGEKVMISDRSQNIIQVYEPTAFSKLVDRAIEEQRGGLYEKAEKSWQEVLQLCSGYDLASLSLARIKLQRKEYSSVMQSLKAMGETEMYSQAFVGWRESLLRSNFSYLFVLVLVLAVLLFVLRVVRRFRAVRVIDENRTVKQLRYGKYLIVHPFEGYWGLKHEKSGGMNGALIIVLMAALIFLLNLQFGGYLFTVKDGQRPNLLFEFLKVAIPLGLWCISNWCFTTLMDGKGNIKDIFISVAYALVPYVLLGLPLLVLSNVLTLQEQEFYLVFQGFITAWVLALLFFGMMVTHDYSFGKAVVTAVLTIVGILLIIFIALLFVNMITEMVNYLIDIYRELQFRV